MPLCARRSAYSAREALAQLRVGRVEHVRAAEVEPEPRSRAAHRRPRGRAASARRRAGAAGSRPRAARARRCPRAARCACAPRPRAVEQRVLEHQRRDRLRAGDVDAVEQVVAVHVGLEERQRLGDLARRVARDRALARARQRRRLVGVVRASARPAARRRSSPSGPRIVSGGRRPPVSTTPAGEGRTVEACANIAASSTSARSPGVISTAPSSMRSIRFGSVIAATIRCSASRPSSSGVARDHLAVARGRDLPDRRRHQQVDLRQRVDRQLAGARHRVEQVRRARGWRPRRRRRGPSGARSSARPRSRRGPPPACARAR